MEKNNNSNLTENNIAEFDQNDLNTDEQFTDATNAINKSQSNSSINFRNNNNSSINQQQNLNDFNNSKRKSSLSSNTSFDQFKANDSNHVGHIFSTLN